MATRDPVLPSAGHGAASADSGRRLAGLARLMTAVQMVGTLLAIPVGVASGYSIYRANFSPDVTCQTLRANIIATLDKNVEASVLRALVRRNVESFEHNCAAEDPDATAAFKTLLNTSRATVAPAAPAAPVRVTVPTMPAPAATAAPAAASVPEPRRPPEVEASRRRPASDAAWISAVRHALAQTPHQAAEPDPAPDLAVSRLPLQPPAVTPPPATTLPSGPPPVAAAPVTPPNVAGVPAPAAAAAPTDALAAGHPVPPAPITGTAPVAEAPARAEPRFGALIARVPLLGGMVDALSGGSRLQ